MPMDDMVHAGMGGGGGREGGNGRRWEAMSGWWGNKDGPTRPCAFRLSATLDKQQPHDVQLPPGAYAQAPGGWHVGR